MSALAKGDLVEVLDVEDKMDLAPWAKEGSRRDTREPIHAEKFIGRVGRIVAVNTGGAWSVGNTPKDPLYTVHVPALGEDGFWAEELKKLA